MLKLAIIRKLAGSEQARGGRIEDAASIASYYRDRLGDQDRFEGQNHVQREAGRPQDVEPEQATALVASKTRVP